MPCDPKLLGVQLVFKKGNGISAVWLDLDQARALRWCTEADGGPPGPHGQKGTPPTWPGPNGPPSVHAAVEQTADTLCWWNGEEWVCGDLE